MRTADETIDHQNLRYWEKELKKAQDRAKNCEKNIQSLKKRCSQHSTS